MKAVVLHMEYSAELEKLIEVKTYIDFPVVLVRRGGIQFIDNTDIVVHEVVSITPIVLAI